ncbi:catechol 2,3-dioxygenase-like lactoylglutathione lyase family enzyme [Dyadobacter jejuensis]|uniref:Catechol 2,3-dioxygenase-like lactoylglutathione lyase family enzyme n=1 Tax=Dyadobacter jejuensis TaxID=1082580 RepID=A0A316AG95_9BACT|nr:VOC family protein [Dyadobacter jejuensis]PWJ56723.1 catechol 2,3-dioxygenase-like lactoylglutathione lyase family enzyme [Dyadobacter jejuensis]
MSIIFERIDHVMLCIPVGAEQQARAFYGGVLGLTELTDLGYPIPNGAIWYQIGNIQLHIRAEESGGEISQRHPAFIVADLENARQRLMDANIRLRNDSQIPDRKRFSFWDPFDNRIELIEMLP